MQEKLLADTLMTIGMMIGLVTQLNAMRDKDTKWPRKSSLTNVITYPITAFAPYFLLELWATLALGLLKYGLRVFKYLYRAPENEDWLGRKV